MFERIEMAPADTILGLKEAFEKDPNPNKINLSVGVYQDAKGETPVFRTVKKAEERILAEETTKSYLNIYGSEEYAAAVQKLILGEGHEVIASKKAATAHTAGGTCALRVAGDFVRTVFPTATIWISDPTWGNHTSVFQAAGLNIKKYPYIPAEDIVLLHACCHNPTGMDPSPEQWQVVADVAADRGWIPLFDLAYQGFARGVDEDAQGIRLFLKPGCELVVCSSFSKNFGLYNERVGALTVIGATADATDRAFSHIKKAIRANYSNPPAHGGKIVTVILGNGALSKEWEEEVEEMRSRIQTMRELFVKTLQQKGVKRDFSFLTRQKGIFSFSGLTKEQVAALRRDYSIYIVEAGGRINVAGITERNMDRLCAAIAAVLNN